MRRRRFFFLSAASVLLVFLVGLVAAATVNGVGYRLTIVRQKATGGLPDVSWGDLLYLLDPRTGAWLEALAADPNPYASIAGPEMTASDATQGKDLYLSRCAGCHALDGRGITGPALVGRSLQHGNSNWALYRTIRMGVPRTAMVAQSLSRRETWQVIAHLSTLAGAVARAATDANHAGVQSTYPEVTFDRLRRAEGAAGADGWLTFSGSYNGQRYSPLSQINRTNVRTLGVSWIRLVNTVGSENVQSTPLVNGDIMFVTAPPQRVIAVSAQTGAILWEYTRSLPADLHTGYGTINRGVALFKQLVFVGTLDAHLVALDAKTGEVRWDVEVAPYREDYTLTGAPLAVDGLIVTGVSGGDYATRGFIDAYDAATGQRRWRFHTIPGPGEPGHDTWPSHAWAIGGAATWLSGSFDPARNLLLWGVGNPAPGFAGDLREGDNLYSNSAVALDAATGKLAWHFQFTPHDEWDFDSVQIPVLANLSQWGGLPDTVLWANRNGFFYLLDGRSGAFLRGTEFARQSWARGLDSKGRPIRVEGASPSPRGTFLYPHSQGATSWWPPTFSPKTGFFYVPALDGPMLAFRSGASTPQPGKEYRGGSVQYLSNEAPVATVKALAPTSGEVIWRYQPTRADSRPVMGLMSTGGGLVFASDGTSLVALDDASGKPLWQFDTSQLVRGAPITFLVNGRQHVAIAAGALLLAFSLPGE